MNAEEKILSAETESRIKRFKFALSLARRAGKALCGTPLVCDAIRAGSLEFVIISASASENSKKRVSNCATHYNVKILYTELTPEALVRLEDRDSRTLLQGNGGGHHPGRPTAHNGNIKALCRHRIHPKGAPYAQSDP